jgi:hypothetical protein
LLSGRQRPWGNKDVPVGPAARVHMMTQDSISPSISDIYGHIKLFVLTRRLISMEYRLLPEKKE